MASSSSKKTLSKDDWERKLSQVKLNKKDLNKLVMNYLVLEGYKDAAMHFQQESATDPGIELGTIGERMDIRTSIVQKGNIPDAISKVNSLNPDILDTNPSLIFHLKQQQLIEYIRNNNIDEALKFAEAEIAPRAVENANLLEELEKTMGLLAFENQSTSPLSFLFDLSHRQKTASELNAAILTSQCQEKDPKLPTLLKMLTWSQQRLDEKCNYPKMNLQAQYQE